jgi:hypothetical protein
VQPTLPLGDVDAVSCVIASGSVVSVVDVADGDELADDCCAAVALACDSDGRSGADAWVEQSDAVPAAWRDDTVGQPARRAVGILS